MTTAWCSLMCGRRRSERTTTRCSWQSNSQTDRVAPDNSGEIHPGKSFDTSSNYCERQPAVLAPGYRVGSMAPSRQRHLTRGCAPTCETKRRYSLILILDAHAVVEWFSGQETLHIPHHDIECSRGIPIGIIRGGMWSDHEVRGLPQG